MTSINTFNIGILAQLDAGKTSLTERLGVIDAANRVDDGSTRPIRWRWNANAALRSSPPLYPFDDLTAKLIDTPGHPDFIAKVERVLRVLDGAVLVISAIEGAVQVFAERGSSLLVELIGRHAEAEAESPSSSSGQRLVVISMDVYVPIGRHVFRTNPTVTIAVGSRPHMLMPMMVVMVWCLMEFKLIRAPADGLCAGPSAGHGGYGEYQHNQGYPNGFWH